MKIHTLKTPYFVLALLVAIAVGEALASQLAQIFGLHFSGVAIAALSVGLVVLVVSLTYDGRD